MEDPKFPLHALHIHFLDCSRPKAQWLHFRKYISNKLFPIIQFLMVQKIIQFRYCRGEENWSETGV